MYNGKYCALITASVMIGFDTLYIYTDMRACVYVYVCVAHLHAKWKTIFNILGIDKV